MYNKLQRKFAICCLIMMIITPFTTCYAASVEECGKALAEFSLSFAEATNAEDSKVVTHYSYDPPGCRESAYKDEEYSGCTHKKSEYSGKTDLGMDCVGWVSYAVHHCYGIGEDSFTYFVAPQSPYIYEPFERIFSNNPADWKIGDVLRSNHHVMIYVGNNKIVDSNYVNRTLCRRSSSSKG